VADGRPDPGVTFAAASQVLLVTSAFVWRGVRALGLLIGEWINRYVNFWADYFPISLVFPSALIVPRSGRRDPASFGSYVITPLSALWAGACVLPEQLAGSPPSTSTNSMVSFRPSPTLSPALRPHLDPEYIRMVERGTCAPSQDVVRSRLFSGFVSMMVYFLWCSWPCIRRPRSSTRSD